MTVDLAVVRDTPVARLVGDIDMSNVPLIEDQIARHVSNRAFAVVVDLSGVTYLDSSGIRLLYQLESRVSNRQQRLVVIVPRGAEINRTLEASGALGTLKIVRSEDEAFAALAG
jgi:anti-anti-sigma factor